jgi:6-pyruvoyltetrahydropterin/6-carboxytetrahydropterin synthase
MVYLTRKEHFNAAHRLHNPAWSDEKNLEVFGKCANPNWHGHNYTLYITVKGEVDPDKGFVLNLKELSTVIRKYVCEKIDHKNMNIDVDFLKGIMPSTENVAIAIWKQLEKHVIGLGGQLHCVRLHETENNYVEYFG